MITSFDLFGTLVETPPLPAPAAAIARELEARSIPVPDDWTDAFSENHLDLPEGRALSLPEHTVAALESRGIDLNEHEPSDRAACQRVSQAVRAAFDPAAVTTRDGATEAVNAAAEHGDVAVLSNCTVPGLVSRTLTQSSLDGACFGAVVSSVECGWRKPDRRAFDVVTERLDSSLSDLIHVGDDPQTDGGADAVGATSILLSETPLTTLPRVLEDSR